MTKKRRRHSAEYKFKVAIEATKGNKTLSQLAQQFQLHPGQISAWKHQLLDEGGRVFENNRDQKHREEIVEKAELYEQIGRLKMELEWLKKKFAPLDRG